MTSVKIVGICCSPRKGETTYKAMQQCMKAAQDFDARIETQIIELAEYDIGACLACNCCKNELSCAQDDDFNDLVPILADENVGGMVIGTPVYFGTMTAQCKALIDRCVLFRRNGWKFRNRAGGVLAVGGVRNGGQELTIQAVQAAMLCHDMLCVSEGFPTAHFGATLFSGLKDGIEADEFGMETARNLGRRIAEVALKMHPPGGRTSS